MSRRALTVFRWVAWLLAVATAASLTVAVGRHTGEWGLAALTGTGPFLGFTMGLAYAAADLAAEAAANHHREDQP
jgi:hypothetical protein